MILKTLLDNSLIKKKMNQKIEDSKTHYKTQHIQMVIQTLKGIVETI